MKESTGTVFRMDAHLRFVVIVASSVFNVSGTELGTIQKLLLIDSQQLISIDGH